jgi:hypothetical protein
MISRFLAGCSLAMLGVGVLLAPVRAPAADPKVVELTQVPCQFLEPEGKDHDYKSTSRADCVAINMESEAARLAEAKPIKLRPGRYIFRVTNRNVPYELGFWLRGDGLLNRLSLPSTVGGGLATGATQDFEILLEKGEYVFSCPQNPTPSYKLVVK